MHFQRYGKFEFRDTALKRAALARKQKKEREAFPLFADEIAENQPSADAEMQRREELWSNSQAKDRHRRAEKWQEARAKLRSYPEQERCKLLAYWNKRIYPGAPEYLLSMMHSYDMGRLDMEPVYPAQTEAQRQKVAAVIEQIAARNREKAKLLIGGRR